MRLPLEGRVGVVTGGASGIGRATVIACVNAGARVVIADLDETGARETIAACADADAVDFVPTNVADADAAVEMVTFTVARYGRLDFAHNNAGVASNGWDLADIPVDEFARVLAVNLTAVWYCMRAEIPVMLENGGGSIINTASSVGLAALPRLGAYTTAKHGVIGLTRAAALDYSARGVRVNAICPGMVDTPQLRGAVKEDPELQANIERLHPMGRAGTPEEIAAGVVWLASDASAFVAGHPLAVDGGYLAQ